jgi:peptidoglycan/LPS O-acetylase OafA/YrhL
LRQRYHFLDGMRGIAALIVVFHHGLLNFTNALYTGERTAANLLSLGLCCTALTFPFLLQYVPIGPGFSGSLSNFPMALFACLREALFNATISGQEVVTYNGVLWTMQIEFIGSLLLIAVFWLSRKTTKTIDDAMNMATFIAILILILWWQSNLALFACGVVFYRVAMHGLEQRLWKEVLAIPIFGLALYLGTMPQAFSRPALQTELIRFTGIELSTISHESLIYPILDYLHIDNWVPFPFLPVNIWHGVGAVFLLWSTLLSRKLRDFFSMQRCQFLGKISFGLYLTHAIVQHVTAQPSYDLMTYFGVSSTIAMLVALLVFVACSLLLATAFTHVIEGRAIRWSERVSTWFSSKALCIRWG